MPEFVPIAKVGVIAPGQGKLIEVRGKAIALFNVNGDYYAIDDECPHQGGSLSDGDLMGQEVACPWHGATFDVLTGEVLGPPASEGVCRYNLRISGDTIEVEI